MLQAIFFILLAITLWNLVLTISGKADKSLCFCGIVAYCGSKPADPMLVRLLLMFNLERGEDSTGWCINNEIIKDTEPVGKFLAAHGLSFSKDHENYTFIGHARKASVGSKSNKELAHPFGIYKDKIEKERYDLVLAMNGTLSLIEEYAKEFDEPYSYGVNSDTQILARIIAKLGEKNYYRALERYSGTATLVFFTPKYPNTLMIYKDKEKPLFKWQKSESECYISSIKEAFLAVGAQEADIEEFAENKVYRINKGKITKEVPITRNPITYVYKNTSSKDQYWESGGSNRGQSNFFPNASGNNNNRSNTSRSKTDKPLGSFQEIFKNSTHVQRMGDKIYAHFDRYYRNGHPVHGKPWINPDGKIKWDEKEAGFNATYKKRFFIAGYDIKNEELYNEIINTCAKDGVFDNDHFKKNYKPSKLVNYTENPLVTLIDDQFVFVIPQEMEDHFKKKGEQATISLEFSNYEFLLEYQGEKFSTTNRFIGRCIEVKQAKKENSDSDLDEVKNEFTDKKNEQYIKNSIVLEDNISGEVLYQNIKAGFWKKNESDKIRQHFYENVLLDLLVNEECMTETAKESITREAGIHWGKSKVQEEISQSINKLRKKLINQSQVAKNDTNLTNDIDDDSIEDSAVELENEIVKFDKPLSASDLLKKIQKQNNYCSSASLSNSIYDCEHETLELMMVEFVNEPHESNQEYKMFLEAVMIFMWELEMVDANTVIESIQKEHKDFLSDVKSYYKQFYVATKNPDEDEKKSKQIEKNDKSEDLTPEEVENEWEASTEDLLENISIHIKDMECIPQELRTPRFQKLLDVTKTIVNDVKESIKTVNVPVS